MREWRQGELRVSTDSALLDRQLIRDFLAQSYVFVVATERGSGLAKWLMVCVFEHPDLQGLRRFMLATRDAHGLYEPFGFRALGDPAKFMEIARPGLYGNRTGD